MELWRQAGGATKDFDRARYLDLMRQHGHLLSPGDAGYGEAPEGPCGWPARSQYRERATRSDAGELAEAVIDLGRLALAFGRIDRTACFHPDGVTRESDTDHTVMLGWVAPALAARCFPSLNVGLVAQFALIHDLPEVYAGDTPTLRITGEGRRAKAEREAAALIRLHREFGDRLPWLPRTLALYEEQVLPEARFVRGLDKCLPKIVHLLDGCAGLREEEMSATEVAGCFERQGADMRRYVGEFTDLTDLHTELTGRVVVLHAASCGTGSPT